jgi:hypothetical protein
MQCLEIFFRHRTDNLNARDCEKGHWFMDFDPPFGGNWKGFRDESIAWGKWVVIVLGGAWLWGKRIIAFITGNKKAGTTIATPDNYFDDARKQGSRECGPQLQALHNEFSARWWDGVNRNDDQHIAHTLSGLYERLKHFVWDHDGKVIQEACWKRLVKLLKNVNTLAKNAENGNVPSEHGSLLLEELNALAKAFPQEAGDVPEPAAPSPTPMQLCGQNLQQIYQAYDHGWKEARQDNNVGKAWALIEAANTALSAVVAEYQLKITLDDRWVNFAVHRQKWISLLENENKINESDVMATGDVLFFEMMQIAHAMQLNR